MDTNVCYNEPMRRTAVQFGAGQIGRGFTGALFHESGFRVVFVEAVTSLVERLNARAGYQLRIVGEGASEKWIDSVTAIAATDTQAIARELREAEVACTAVGVSAMPDVARLLAVGVLARYEASETEPLNILICENQIRGDRLLREMVRGHLPAFAHAYLNETIGFAQCVVSRMVPIATEEERKSLIVRAEAYKSLPVDKAGLRGALPDIVGLTAVDGFEGFIERKLYVHNASHAMVGYFGALKGYELGCDAVQDDQIRGLVAQAMGSMCEALHRHHGMPLAELRAHVDDLLRRYANRELGDTVFRLARDPLRKLRPDDRLVGGLRLVRDYNLDSSAWEKAIAAALRWKHPQDPGSIELQSLIAKNGVKSVLTTVCGIQTDSAEAAEIAGYFDSITTILQRVPSDTPNAYSRTEGTDQPSLDSGETR